MAIKGRQTLYSIFINGAIPTQQDYRDLIDSALNRRDDHFFGEWKKGTKYCKDDVVIFKKALYKLDIQKTEGPCPPEDDTEPTDGCICSTEEPPKDKNWCELELKIKDADWEIILKDPTNPDSTPETIYQLTADVGIGTDKPQALLDVTDQNKILLQPDDAGSPLVRMEKHEDIGDGYTKQKQYVNYKLSEQVCWESDSLAYVFKLDKNAGATEQKSALAPVLLMIVTTDDDGHPSVGIGIEKPEGRLHVHQDERGKMLVNPGQNKEPGICLVNLEKGGPAHFYLVGVNDDYTYFTTDASGGFRFKKSNKNHDELADCESSAGGDSLVAILPDGYVGIGTEEPQSNLEVTDGGDSGSIRLQLGDKKGISNPAISIKNDRPKSDEPTYVAVGVDNAQAIFITDAEMGFVFKKGGPCGENDNEININQGDGCVFISPAGKLGVQTKGNSDDYDLDVNGSVRSLTSHLMTDSKCVNKTENLGEVLDKVMELCPIKFKWKKDKDSVKDEQIGLMAANVNEFFPELVECTGSEKAVAYGNLTAVLVKAIQEQQQIIKDMDERICDLEEKRGE